MDEEPPPPYSEVASAPPWNSFRHQPQPHIGVPESRGNQVQEAQLRSEMTQLEHFTMPELIHLTSIQNSNAENLEDCWMKLKSYIKLWKADVVASVNIHFDNLLSEGESSFKNHRLCLQQDLQKLQCLSKDIHTVLTTGNLLVRTGNHNDIRDLNEKISKIRQEIDSLQRETLGQTMRYKWEHVKPEFETVDTQIKEFIGKTQLTTINTGPQSNTSTNMQLRVDNQSESAAADQPEEYSLLYSFSTKTYLDKARCHPLSFCVTPHGNIIIPDRFNRKVKVFTLRGQLVFEITDPVLLTPTYAALNSIGHIAVSDSESAAVHMFTSDGVRMGAYVNLMKPQDIQFTQNDFLLVVDSEKNAVEVFAPMDFQGPPVLTISVYELSVFNEVKRKHEKKPFKFFAGPVYLTSDKNNNIIVSDREGVCIQVHAINGNFIGRYGSRGSDVGKFKEPYGVSLALDGGVLVADYGNNRIQHIMINTSSTKIMIGKEQGLNFPTQVCQLPDGRIIVSEYMTKKIKVFGTQMHADNERANLPPSYDEIYNSNNVPRNLESSTSPSSQSGIPQRTISPGLISMRQPSAPPLPPPRESTFRPPRPMQPPVSAGAAQALADTSETEGPLTSSKYQLTKQNGTPSRRPVPQPQEEINQVGDASNADPAGEVASTAIQFSDITVSQSSMPVSTAPIATLSTTSNVRRRLRMTGHGSTTPFQDEDQGWTDEVTL